MNGTGAWACEYPGCDRLAVTQCRTAYFPWMKLCGRHRLAWKQLAYPDELADAYRNAGPHRRLSSGDPWHWTNYR
jgi:hypothetical protein